ncbi:MAG TPA: hypothetical protein VG759_09195 [Candidatus Angelobacter sp.]|jgi:hypothetical protein|nr:hypothetical protein [Candidatus Angelobacter sp.]
MDNDNSARETLSIQVRRALADMAEIRHSLTEMPELELDPGKQERRREILDIELAAELKSAVDAMRQMLWAYVQALSAKSGRPPQEVMDWYKMELAVEMLRSVRSRNRSAMASNAVQEPTWSFDKLCHDAMEVLEQHQRKTQ